MERARRAAIAAALILGAALLVALGRTVFGSWHATGDHAVIELRTLDVGGRHTPLVGPYSRYGWSHPGPALFFALAPVLRLFAGRDIGLLAGAVVLNALALGCIFVLVWRRRDTAALVFTILVATVLVRALGGQALLDPWNPYVIVLPLFACAICAWSAAGGSRWALVATVVLASFVAQTHIGAAPAAIALVGFAFAWAIADTFRARDTERRRRVTSLALATTAGVVVWLPPVVQAATSDGGNLRAIWDFWSQSHVVSGWTQGARLVAPQFAVPAPWMGVHENTALGGALAPGANRFPVALILLVVVTVLAARRRDRESLVLCSLAGTLSLAAWVAASRIVGIQYVYLLRWSWVAGAVTWLAVLCTAWRSLPESRRTAREVTLAVAAATSCVLAVFVVGSVARASYPEHLESSSLDHVRGPVLAALRTAPEPVLIDGGQALRSAGVAIGLLLDARHAGFDARVPSDLAYRIDKSRTLGDGAKTVLIVASDDAVASASRDPANKLLVRYDSLSAADRRELTRLEDFVNHDIRKLIELKRDHRRDYDRLVALDARGAVVAVFERTARPATSRSGGTT